MLTADLQLELRHMAVDAMVHAYAPYSEFRVGAAIYTAGQKLFSGCNVENASFGMTICAERVAIGKAISEGERKILAVAVATKNGDSPCGACRQVINEFADPTCEILICNSHGDLLGHHTLSTLLPLSFGANFNQASPDDNHPR